MTIRTTAELVAAIIEVDEDIDLTPFIEAAASLVSVIVEKARPPLTEERLEIVERYLSAHVYTLRDPRTTKEDAGPVSESFQSAVDLYLNTSHYGQFAQVLDTSGVLRAMGKGFVQSGVIWLGKKC